MAATRDIIVVGGSAGGLEALKKLVSLLPPDLPAAIFAVFHVTPWAALRLPEVLAQNGLLPAQYPESGKSFVRGNIYVAPPDSHMLLEKHSIRLWRGPKENLHRPAVNPLFRSAAVHFRQRVVGVILSGTRDDGSDGLWWVKQFGGLAIVQDPDEAAFPDMPESAMEHVSVDYVLDVAGIASQLTALTTDAGAIRGKAAHRR